MPSPVTTGSQATSGSRLRRFVLATGLLLALFIFGTPGAALAEFPGQFKVHGWQVQHGLPQDNVIAITQTPDGFLWLASPDNLARFDGSHFEVFTAKRIPQLVSSKIHQLYADSQGTLWIGTDDGSLIRMTDGQFESIQNPNPNDSHSPITAITKDSKQVLWFMSEDGSVTSYGDGKFTTGPVDWIRSGTAPFKLFSTSHGEVWAANRLNLYELQPHSSDLVLEGTFGQYQFLAPSRNGGWWIAMGGKVRLWKDEQWIGERGAPTWDRQSVTACLEDAEGRLWIGTSGQGLFRHDPDGAVERFTTREGLGSDLVQALWEDHEGNIWVGTNGGGINRIHHALFQVFGKEQGLSSSAVNSIAETTDGAIWIGTDDSGLNRFKDGLISPVRLGSGLDSQIRSVLAGPNATLFTSTLTGKLFKNQGDSFIPVAAPLFGTKTIQCLFLDSKQRLWLGQQSTEELVQVTSSSATATRLVQSKTPTSITCLAEDPNGFLWTGTDGQGLFATGPEGGQHWGKFNGLPNDTIHSLFPQKDGSLWIGTAGGGLVRLKNKRFVTCGIRDGLPDLSIHNIQEDSQGFLWMSSNQGIFRVSLKQLNDFADGIVKNVRCTSFGIFDGLPSLKCLGGFQPAGCKTRDGRIWFPTQKGMAVIDPSAVDNGTPPPPVFLQEIRVDGDPQNTTQTSPLQSQALHIEPGPHHYEFRYTGIHFRSPERVRFRYKMEGLEKEWQDAGSQRSAVYNALPHGRYRFHVQASIRDGSWSPAGATVELIVAPQLWERPWILLLSVLTATTGIALIARSLTRRRWRKRLRELELHQKVEAERNRIAQDIHDDLGAGLTQIGWLGEMNTRLADNPDSVRQQSRKIIATAREMVTSLDEIVWAVRPQNDSLQSLVEYLGRRVDELFENSSIRAWFEVSGKLPEMTVLADVRHQFFLACKEALHNVLKHSCATEVRLKVVFQEPSTLHISITDNGHGFEPGNPKSEGNGLGNMKDRITRLGGHFVLKSSDKIGCVIEITIPLTNAGETS